MASIIQIKRSSTSGSPTTLQVGELAYSYQTAAANTSNGGDTLYIGVNPYANGEAQQIVAVGGEYYTEKLRAEPGELTANAAIITGANSTIDMLLVDDIKIDGDTISSNATNGDLVLQANGTGNVVITSNFTVLGGSITIPTLSNNRITFFSGGSLTDSANLAYYTANTTVEHIGSFIQTGNTTVNGDLHITGLTNNSLLFNDNANTIATSANLDFFTANSTMVVNGAIIVGGDGVSTTGNVVTDDIHITTLSSNRLMLSQSDKVVDDANLTFHTANSTLGVTGNVAITGELTVTGNTTLDGLNIDGQTITGNGANADIIIIPDGTQGVLKVDTTSGIVVPVGNTGQRTTSAETGEIRFNTDQTAFEGFDGTNFTSLGGVIDANRETYIIAKQDTSLVGPQGAANTLTFVAANVEQMSINSTGIFANSGTFFDLGDIRIHANTISTETGTLYIDPAPAGSNGTLVIRGDLQVSGTTTTINSQTTTVNDPIFTIGDTVFTRVTTAANTSATVIPLDNTTDVVAGDGVSDGGNAVPVGANVASVNSSTITITASLTSTLASNTELTITSQTDDNKDRGIEFKYVDGTAKTGYFGYEDGNGRFTFIPDATNTSEVFTGSPGSAEFHDLYLHGAIRTVDNTAPVAGQLLIGHGTNQDMELATLTAGQSITITNADASITIDADEATAVVTANGGIGVYGANTNNDTATGVASFASEQFAVTSGHVYMTNIDGGTY